MSSSWSKLAPIAFLRQTISLRVKSQVPYFKGGLLEEVCNPLTPVLSTKLDLALLSCFYRAWVCRRVAERGIWLPFSAPCFGCMLRFKHSGIRGDLVWWTAEGFSLSEIPLNDCSKKTKGQGRRKIRIFLLIIGWSSSNCKGGCRKKKKNPDRY